MDGLVDFFEQDRHQFGPLLAILFLGPLQLPQVMSITQCVSGTVFVAPRCFRWVT